MTELTVVEKESEWRRLKRLVLDAVSSPTTRRVYNLALDEFIEWYDKEGRCGFTKSTVNAWRSSLESRGLGSSSINGRLSAIRKLAHEAGDNGLLAPEIASAICRVRGSKTTGVRMGNWLSLQQAQMLLNAPDTATSKGSAGSGHFSPLHRLRFTQVRSGCACTCAHSAIGWTLVHCRPQRQARTHSYRPDSDLG